MGRPPTPTPQYTPMQDPPGTRSCACRFTLAETLLVSKTRRHTITKASTKVCTAHTTPSLGVLWHACVHAQLCATPPAPAPLRTHPLLHSAQQRVLQRPRPAAARQLLCQAAQSALRLGQPPLGLRPQRLRGRARQLRLRGHGRACVFGHAGGGRAGRRHSSAEVLLVRSVAQQRGMVVVVPGAGRLVPSRSDAGGCQGRPALQVVAGATCSRLVGQAGHATFRKASFKLTSRVYTHLHGLYGFLHLLQHAVDGAVVGLRRSEAQ